MTISVRVITRLGSNRVARVALELARSRRKLLTLVHKNTVFKLGCGMFVEECYKAARDFPDVTVNEVIVDTMAMRLVRDPQNFDVVVTTNMFGDILTDEAAGLVGGLGDGAGALHRRRRFRDGAGHARLGPDIAGTGKANPYAMIDSTRMLLDWLGLTEALRRLSRPPIPCSVPSLRHWQTRRQGPATSAGPVRRPR